VTPGQRLRITSDLAPNAGKAKRAGGKKVLSTHAKPAPKPASRRGMRHAAFAARRKTGSGTRSAKSGTAAGG
jgi:hypothetical protein